MVEQERSLQHADLAAVRGLTQQYRAEAGYRAKTWTDFDATLSRKETTIVTPIAKADAAPKAATRPVLNGNLGVVGKAEAQPLLEPAPVLVQTPPAKPEKKMVGPDGVVYVRTATAAPKAVAVVKPPRPVAPASLGLADQAKVLEGTIAAKATVSEPELVSAPQAESDIPLAPSTKVNAVMVGPDGVIYQAVQRTSR
jgi:hypothetical protein